MKKEFFLILILIVGGGTAMIWALFGGSGNKDVVNSVSMTGFIDDLVNSGTIENGTGDVSSNIIDGKVEIGVMMPSYFYTLGWRQFAQNLLSEQNVYIKFSFIDDLNEYRDVVESTGFSGADLILVPYDWIDKIQTKNFSFQQSLQSAYDPFVSDIVTDSNLKFLPFAVDPMMIYAISGHLSHLSFSEIGELAYNRENQRVKSFPVFFGLLDEDHYGQGFQWEYQDIVWYALMHYFTTQHDVENLGTWIDSNAIQGYSYSNLYEILDLITSSTPACKNFPAICFQLYKFVGVRFGFLSDIDIVKHYFSSKIDIFNDLSVSKIPLPSQSYILESPVRLWGWAIPSSVINSDTINAIYAFLMQYMNKHGDYTLRNSTYSAFAGSNLEDETKIGLRGYIMTTGGNFLQDMQNNKKFWQLINYQISANDYIQKN